jgi:hypothetical protein
MSDFISRAFSEKDLYLYIIDTDSYAGNFSREMCAFITGVVGECYVGLEESLIVRGELTPEEFAWFKDNVFSFSDDHGVSRPCSTFPNPRWYNVKGKHFRFADKLPEGDQFYPAYNSVAIFFGTMPPKPTRELVVKRAREYVSRETLYEGEDEGMRDSIGRLGITIESFRIVQLKTEVVDCTPPDMPPPRWDI